MRLQYFVRRSTWDRLVRTAVVFGGLVLATLTTMCRLSGQEPEAKLQLRQRPDGVPSYAEYSRRMQQVLRREATAESPDERAAAVQEMCILFSRLVTDPRYASSPTLQGYKSQLGARLRRVKADLERQMSRQRREDERRSKRAGVTSSDERSSGADFGLANAMELATQTVGGPCLFFGVTLSGWHVPGAAGGAAVWDYGPALVELIQRTITPSFWDVNGGPGTIVYYRPLRVLVVRATPGMHIEVGEGLGKLRGR